MKITVEEEGSVSDLVEMAVLRTCNHPNILNMLGCWNLRGETIVC
jgi:hypothetical protein